MLYRILLILVDVRAAHISTLDYLTCSGHISAPQAPIQQLRCGVCRPGGSLEWSLGSDRALLPPPCGEAWAPQGSGAVWMLCVVWQWYLNAGRGEIRWNSQRGRDRERERENDSWGEVPKVTWPVLLLRWRDAFFFKPLVTALLRTYFWISQNWCGQTEASQSIVLPTCVPLHTSPALASWFVTLRCSWIKLEHEKTWLQASGCCCTSQSLRRTDVAWTCTMDCRIGLTKVGPCSWAWWEERLWCCVWWPRSLVSSHSVHHWITDRHNDGCWQVLIKEHDNHDRDRD